MTIIREFLTAAFEGKIVRCHLLFPQFEDLIRKDWIEKTLDEALYLAAKNMRLDVIDFLIPKGASISSAFKKSIGNSDVYPIKALLIAGINGNNIKIQHGFFGELNPIEYWVAVTAANNYDPAVCETLLQAGITIGKARELLHHAPNSVNRVNRNRWKLENTMVRLGLLDLKLQGKTPEVLGITLHEAIKERSLAIVACCLQAGADVNFIDASPNYPLQEDLQGYTPMDKALFYNYPELVALLLYYGVDPTSRTVAGYTRSHSPLHKSIDLNSKKCLRTMIAFGAIITSESLTHARNEPLRTFLQLTKTLQEQPAHAVKQIVAILNQNTGGSFLNYLSFLKNPFFANRLVFELNKIDNYPKPLSNEELQTIYNLLETHKDEIAPIQYHFINKYIIKPLCIAINPEFNATTLKSHS